MVATGEFPCYQNIDNESIRINYYRIRLFKQSIHSPKCAKSVAYLHILTNLRLPVLFEMGSKSIRLTRGRTVQTATNPTGTPENNTRRH